MSRRVEKLEALVQELRRERDDLRGAVLVLRVKCAALLANMANIVKIRVKKELDAEDVRPAQAHARDQARRPRSPDHVSAAG